MKTQTFGNVWDAIEDTKTDAEHMKLRSQLMLAIEQFVKDNKLTQAQAAQLFGVTQPRISDLLRGKINLFSLDSLVTMVAAIGAEIEMSVSMPAIKTSAKKGRGTLAPA
jgi:predicted XRE-type DNA-binding protein